MKIRFNLFDVEELGKGKLILPKLWLGLYFDSESW